MAAQRFNRTALAHLDRPDVVAFERELLALREALAQVQEVWRSRCQSDSQVGDVALVPPTEPESFTS